MSRIEGKRVAVVMGGESNEREVSLRTGAALAAALRARSVYVEEIDLVASRFGELVAMRPDVVVVALHGGLGEGGPLQGFLECLDIPYTGSGVLASALAMDKVRAKRVFGSLGIPTPRWTALAHGSSDRPAEFVGPCVVKPSLDGSSVGVTLVREAADWATAVSRARGGAGELLVEDLVRGRELTVGIFDDAVLGTVEVVPGKEFYDYEAKYRRNDTVYRVPAPLEPEVDARVREAALAAYRALGCRGVARTDVMLDEASRPWVLEVNTVPGMTETSLVPKLAAAAGISFPDFAVRMAEAATTDARHARGER